MIRIPWVTKRTNEKVLQMAGLKRELMTVVFFRGGWCGERPTLGNEEESIGETKGKHLGYLGHVLIENSVVRDCLFGTI